MVPYFGDEVGEPGDDLRHKVIIALGFAHQTRPGEDGENGGDAR